MTRVDSLAEEDSAFERASTMFGAIVLFLVVGFVTGWAMRGEQEAGPLQHCRSTLATTQDEARVCSVTLEQSWKQAREVAAGAARCRETLSRQYGLTTP